jgi:hypothetical protein
MQQACSMCAQRMCPQHAASMCFICKLMGLHAQQCFHHNLPCLLLKHHALLYPAAVRTCKYQNACGWIAADLAQAVKYCCKAPGMRADDGCTSAGSNKPVVAAPAAQKQAWQHKAYALQPAACKTACTVLVLHMMQRSQSGLISLHHYALIALHSCAFSPAHMSTCSCSLPCCAAIA